MFRTMQQRPKALSLCVCMGDYNNKTSMIVCCCSDVCNKDLMTGTMQTAQWGQACIPVNSSEIHGTTRGRSYGSCCSYVFAKYKFTFMIGGRDAICKIYIIML
jgi:hypothetical protein